MKYDQNKALEGADFVYAKSWAAFSDPNYGKILSRDRSWTIDSKKMALTSNARFMHCLPVKTKHDRQRRGDRRPPFGGDSRSRQPGIFGPNGVETHIGRFRLNRIGSDTIPDVDGI